MHALIFTATAAVLAIAAVATAADSTQPAATQPGAKSALSGQYQQASYGIGYDLGKNIKQSRVALDPELIIQGLRDCLSGSDAKVSQEQFREAMTMIQGEMQKNAAADAKVAGESAAKAGDTFQAENAKKAGVTVTKSGLQIETIKEGTGASPTGSDTVKVHYTGRLIDGTVFDSSVERGQPISFPLNGVIPGWTEGLQLMKVGGKAKLVIPPGLGYGAAGAPPSIPPNATLVFEVELLDIPKK